MNVSARVQAGFSIAGVTFAGAIFAEQLNACAVIVWGFVVATVVVVVLTTAAVIAPRTRWLHALPGVGAPRLNATLSMNGTSVLAARVRMDGDSPATPERNSLLQVAVKLRDPVNLDDATVTIIVPLNLTVTPTDAFGIKADGWVRMPPYGEELATRDGAVVKTKFCYRKGRFSGRDTHMFYFKLSFAGPGEYPLRIKVTHNALYEDFVVDGVVDVTAQTGDSTPLEIVSDAIAAIEAKQTEPPGNTQAILEIVARARLSVPPEAMETFDAIEVEYEGPAAGPDYWLALTKRYLVGLYEIRRRLGTQGGSGAAQDGQN